MPRPHSIRLNCESLEAREVPAIVLQGTFVAFGTAPTINGGNITVSEVALNRQGGVGDPTTDRNLTVFQNTDKVANAADTITLTNSGSTLTLTDTDGIFVRVVNGASTFFADFGMTAEIQNVTGLKVKLQLGGNDRIVDRTNLDATLVGGLGSDTIIATGGAVNPFVIQQLSRPGGLDPALYSLIDAITLQKKLQGLNGNDTLRGPLYGFRVVLDGGNGRDKLTGGIGPDILIGGAGVDVLQGFGGRDTYNTLDTSIDYIFNQPGDAIAANPFDYRAFP